MWGEHGGEWWAQNGLIDFRSAMGSLFLKELFCRAVLLGERKVEREACRHVG
ncbi:hypothetical protein [Bartonella sp. CL63NXGY]|uniref:hypothetical protein n=1 Tax=Bartonella sp. CL63NXGY TaxID=3243538 RepID=UPI0035D059A6